MSLVVYIKAYREAIRKRDEEEQHRIEKAVRVQCGMDKITLVILSQIQEESLCELKI